MRSPARRVLTALTAFIVASSVMLASFTSARERRHEVGSVHATHFVPIASHTLRMHSSRAVALALLAKMNVERRNRHLRPLQTNRLLAAWANRWARWLLATRHFEHQNLGR